MSNIVELIKKLSSMRSEFVDFIGTDEIPMKNTAAVSTANPDDFDNE